MTRSDPKRDRTVGRAESWTLKGVDPAARARAQDMARRSGVSLAEVLNQLLTDGAAAPNPERGGKAAEVSPTTSGPKRPSRSSAAAPTPKAKRAAAHRRAPSMESEDVHSPSPDEAADDRATILPSRLDRAERSLAAVAVLLEVKLDELSERQEASAHRLEHLEGQQGSRLEASKALEAAIGKVAEQIYEGEARAELQALHTREIVRSLRGRVDRVEAHSIAPSAPNGAELARLEARIARIEAAPATADASAIVAALSALTRRVEEGQQHTLSALQTLGGALAGLERLAHGMDGAPPLAAADEDAPDYDDWADLEPDGVGLSASEAAEVTANALGYGAAESTEASQDLFEAAVRDLVDRVAATEQRSATAINLMGDQVLRLAQSLDSRVDGVERRSDQLASEVGGEVARIADVVDACLSRADEVQAAALGMLGGRMTAAADPALETAAVIEPQVRRALGGGASEASEAPQPEDGDPDMLEPPSASGPPRGLGRNLDWSVESFADAYQPAASAPSQPVEPEPRRALRTLRNEFASTESSTTALGDAGSDPIESQLEDAPGVSATVAEAEPEPEPMDDLTADMPPTVEAVAATKEPASESGAANAPVEMAPPPPGGYQPPPEPVAYPPTPTVRPGSNRELIEQARTAARLSAESKRRSPAEIWSGKSEAKSGSPQQPGEPEDVLDLRNGFGLLKPRRRQGSGG